MPKTRFSTAGGGGLLILAPRGAARAASPNASPAPASAGEDLSRESGGARPLARNPALDLLKITAILMVVVLHTVTHGIKAVDISLYPQAEIYKRALMSFSIVAVNLFVLITGYFYSARKVSYRSVFALWLQVEFYSIGGYLVACAVPIFDVAFSFKTLLRMAMPFLSLGYWFFTDYAPLVLLAPFLNKLILVLDKKTYQKFLFLLFLIFSAIPSINIFGDHNGANTGFSLVWFIVLYFTAAYFRKFGFPRLHYGLFYIGFSVLHFGVFLIGKFLSFVPYLPDLTNILYISYNSVIVYASSVCLFLAAAGCRRSFGRAARPISKIASLSFAVYLVHENVELSGPMWNKLFRLWENLGNLPRFIGRQALAILAIFTVGLLVEMIRRLITPKKLLK